VKPKAKCVLSVIAIPWVLLVVVWAACNGLVLTCIGLAVLSALLGLLASRSYDEIQEDRLWSDAMRHPRI
jgi:hypothetical protein